MGVGRCIVGSRTKRQFGRRPGLASRTRWLRLCSSGWPRARVARSRVLKSLFVSHDLHIVVVVLSTTTSTTQRPKRALFLLAWPSLSLPESVLFPVWRILSAFRPVVSAIVPLPPHLRRDLATHAFNAEPLNQCVDTVPRVQSVQLRFGPSRWARTWSRAPCLRFVIVAVITGFFHGSIVVFNDCDKAAFTR